MQYNKKPRIGDKYKIIHRNDACPCGRKKFFEYRDADGKVFKETEVRNKFKNCCLKKQLEPAGNVMSSHEALKAKRANVGWPMRKHLSVHPSQRSLR